MRTELPRGGIRTWSIPALADEVGSVRHAAIEFARAEGVPDRPLEDLRLAISEAVTNAVVHAFAHKTCRVPSPSPSM
jgi:anti-sigma regulatory factor (Ser/Thr protein kinase)